MSAVSIVIPGGLSSIAVRNAARLYEPVRRLPQIARTLIPFASLIRPLPGCRRPPIAPPGLLQGVPSEASNAGPVAPCACARLALNISPQAPSDRAQGRKAHGAHSPGGLPEAVGP